MNKKLIFINIILLFILYIFSEYISYSLNLRSDLTSGLFVDKTANFITNSFTLPIKNFGNAIKIAENHGNSGPRIHYRKDNYFGTDFNKSPVILYGCSYTACVHLSDDECLSGILTNLTGRPVYNRGLAGYGMQHSLYHIENNLKDLLLKYNSQLLKSLNNNNLPQNLHSGSEPHYAIYTFIEDHVNRLYRPNDFSDKWLMFYKFSPQNDKLIPVNDFDMLFWHSYILRTLWMKKYHNCTDESVINTTERSKLLSAMFLQMKKGLETKINDVQFSIFVFNGDRHIKEIENELIDNGIKIVYLSELSDINFEDEKYRLENDFHPNALAWEIITPLLIKELNL